MAGETVVSLADLRHALASLLDEVERRHGKVVDLDADYYWTIGPWDSFRLDALDGPKPTVGQLTDDVESMKDMLAGRDDREIAVWHDLTHIVGILSRLAALDHPGQQQT
jgi:hypothetical protein